MAEISFSGAFKKGLNIIKKNPFPLKKKCTLSEYAHAILVLTSFSMLSCCIPGIGFIIGGIFSIMTIFWMIARMHDIGRSGWWILVPIYNAFLFFQPSDKNSEWQLGIDGFEFESENEALSASESDNVLEYEESNLDTEFNNQELKDAQSELDKMLND